MESVKNTVGDLLVILFVGLILIPFLYIFLNSPITAFFVLVSNIMSAYLALEASKAPANFGTLMNYFYVWCFFNYTTLGIYVYLGPSLPVITLYQLVYLAIMIEIYE